MKVTRQKAVSNAVLLALFILGAIYFPAMRIIFGILFVGLALTVVIPVLAWLSTRWKNK